VVTATVDPSVAAAVVMTVASSVVVVILCDDGVVGTTIFRSELLIMSNAIASSLALTLRHSVL
jgi:hypothetical protein